MNSSKPQDLGKFTEFVLNDNPTEVSITVPPFKESKANLILKKFCLENFGEYSL